MNPDVIILSSVLQYLENPYELILQIIKNKIPWIFIDRTPFSMKEHDQIAKQVVNPKIYSASYPAWIFSESKFLNCIRNDYDIISEIVNSDIDGRAYFKGYVLRLKCLIEQGADAR
jgi:putative methyltransferase (TIGR04325 family)